MLWEWLQNMGVEPKIGGKNPKWMVKIMVPNPMNKWMIWVVFPYFWVDTICIH